MSTPPVEAGLWDRLRAHSPARIGLGQVGGALPTREALDLQRCHAAARDAVHAPLDVALLVRQLDGLETLTVDSAATDRADYLRRPDLGRRLAEGTPDPLQPGACEVAIVLGDGLSPQAVQDHAPPLVHALVGLLAPLRIAPIVIARQARVALGDDIAVRLGAGLVIVLIGERPGLSVADSLGAYLTFAPRIGRRDSERNCVSNIRPGGMPIDEAARRIHWLCEAAQRLGATGTALKDEYRPALTAESRARLHRS